MRTLFFKETGGGGGGLFNMCCNYTLFMAFVVSLKRYNYRTLLGFGLYGTPYFDPNSAVM